MCVSVCVPLSLAGVCVRVPHWCVCVCVCVCACVCVCVSVCLDVSVPGPWCRILSAHLLDPLFSLLNYRVLR